MNFDLSHFLLRFEAELRSLRELGLLPTDAILHGSWNQYSWLHSRAFGAMVRSIDRPFVPLVEVTWSQRFCPDLCVIDKNDRIHAVIEYESTNSSDERLMGKDLAHFEAAITATLRDADDMPEWWIVISTLPKALVKRWPWWSWNSCELHPPKTKSRELRNHNPFQYYVQGLHDSFDATWGRISSQLAKGMATNLVWVNLDETLSLTLQNLNGDRLSHAG